MERYHCITCIADDYGNQIDLCMHCVHKTVDDLNKTSFTHLPTHSIIRSRRRVLYLQVADILSDAKKKSTRFKDHFRRLEEQTENKGAGIAGTGGGEKNKSKVEVEALLCACCDKEVHLPCWLCLECGAYRQ